LHAFVKPSDGQTVDAFGILAEAISIWEAHVIAPIAD
jgi:hypothetical protein